MISPGQTSVWLDMLAQFCRERNLPLNTQYSHLYSTENYLSWWERTRAERRLTTATAADVDAYVEKLKATSDHLTAGEIRVHLGAIRALYEALISEGLIQANPVRLRRHKAAPQPYEAAYAELLDTFLAWCRKRGLAEATQAVRVRAVKRFLGWWWERSPEQNPAHATTPDLAAYLESIFQAKVGEGMTNLASAVYSHRAALHLFYQALVQSGAAELNPVPVFRGVGRGARGARVITAKQRQDLLKAVDQGRGREKVMALLLLLTDLRVSEILAIEWGHVTPRHIRIPGRSGAGKQMIPVEPAVARALNDWRAEQEASGKIPLPTERVLPVSVAVLYQTLKGIALSVGIKRLSPWTLRTAFRHG